MISRRDWLCAAALWLLIFAVFAPGAGSRGFYYDDAGMMMALPFADLHKLWEHIRVYVPGRNLHILWQYLLYKLAGGALPDLTALHLIQAALDALVVACFFLLLRLLRLPAGVAVIAAGLFGVWPNHGETHFWPSAAPMTLVSALFAILLSMTSLALAAGEPPRPWLWLADGLCFLGALFTYDQVFFVLAAIVIARLVVSRRWTMLLAHLPYLVAAGFFIWLKLTGAPGSGPAARFDPAMLRANLADSVSWTVGRLWFRHVAALYERATSADWLLAVTVAILLIALARRDRHSGLPGNLGRVFLLGLAFYLAAYLPVWFWFIAPRHNYLPSIGLFAGGAACLAWILERLRPAAARIAVMVLLGATAAAFVAADRGESRFWEDSFTLKEQLFAELKPDLGGVEVLVLEDFPARLGPASWISPQDASFAPRLLFHGSLSLPGRFTGEMSSAPAPAGLFLSTLAHMDGERSFRYDASGKDLVVRFHSIENGRVRYDKNPPDPLPYRLDASSVTRKDGPFQIHHVSARRDGADTVLTLRVQAHTAPRTYLTMLLSALHSGGFHRWGRVNRQGALDLQPILLSDAVVDPRSGGLEFSQTIRLLSCPKTDRVRLEFFAASRDNPPVPLGAVEAAVEP